MYFPSSGLTKGYRSRGNLFVSDLAPSRRLKRPRKKRLVYPAPYAIIFPSAVVLQLYVCSVNLLPREFFAPANIFELFTTGWRQQWRKKKKEISNVHRIFPRTRLFIELCIPWEGGKEWLEISIKFLRLLEQIHRERIETLFLSIPFRKHDDSRFVQIFNVYHFADEAKSITSRIDSPR